MISKTVLGIIFLMVLSPIYVHAIPGTISVDIDGTLVDIDYDAEGVEIISTEANLDDISIVFQIKTTLDAGIVEITFDREFFDSTEDGQDIPFFVIIDGFDFIDDPETVTTAEERTLQFEIPFGAEEFEIFGTVLAGSTFEEPIQEPPAIEEPPEIQEPPAVEEKPVIEEPPAVEEKPPMVEEKPKPQCGPGTVLKDGICVLEETCGPGTHLEDGTCVLDEPTSIGISADRSLGTQFIVGVIGAFIIAFIIMIILWIISRGSRQKQTV